MAKKNILIVEDDETLRVALTTILQNQHSVTEAEDGQKALDYLKKNVPDLVLLDIKLPKVNGMEVLKYIRGQKKLQRISVIIISNMENQALVAQGLMLGAKDYLAKSNYSLNDIIEMVEMRLQG